MGHKANVTWVDESFEDIKQLFVRDSRWQLVPNFKSKYTSSTNRSERWENCQNAGNERKQWDHGWELHNPNLLAASPSPRCTLTSQGITNFPATSTRPWFDIVPQPCVKLYRSSEVLSARKVSRRGTFPPEPGSSFSAAFWAALWFFLDLCKCRTRTREIKGPLPRFSN